MFKIYLKGGAVIDIVANEEDSKLNAKDFFAKIRSYKKLWYDSINNVTFIIEEVAAIATVEDTKTSKGNK